MKVKVFAKTNIVDRWQNFHSVHHHSIKPKPTNTAPQLQMLSQNTINIHLNLQTGEAEEEEEKIKFHHLLCVKLYISSVLFVKYDAVIKS